MQQFSQFMTPQSQGFCPTYQQSEPQMISPQQQTYSMQYYSPIKNETFVYRNQN